MWTHIYETVSVALLVAIMLLLILLSSTILLGYDPVRYKRKKKRHDLHTYETIEDSSESAKNRITQTMKIRVCSSESVLVEQEVELKIYIEAVPVRGQMNSRQDENARLTTGTIPRAGPNSYTVGFQAPRRYSTNESQQRPIPPPKNVGSPKMPISPDMIKDRSLFVFPRNTERDETIGLSDSSNIDRPDTVGYLEPTALRKKKLVA